MRARHFRQVDVFTSVPYRGNPLGVVLECDGLTTEDMQRITNWTNLSEVTFLMPPTRPEADYAVRIFCPGRELPFAGHPTLGTCHAWLESGGRPHAEAIVQECGAGLVPIRRHGSRLSFGAPPLRRSGPLSDVEVAELLRGLGLRRDQIEASAWCDNGPGWRALLLSDVDTLLGIKPDAAVIGRLDVGLVAPHPAGSAYAFEVRAFFPGVSGLTEDPVTGSLNAALGQWLIGGGRAPRSYVARQGTVIGREGQVHVDCDAADQVWVGGESVTCIEGIIKA